MWSDFLITEIRPSYYSSAGRLVVEIRAKLDSMSLNDVDNLTAEDAARLSPNEPDPLDEEAPAKAQPGTNPPTVSAEPDDFPFGMTPSDRTNDLEADSALFGTIWPLGDTVRLDTTVDRKQLRQQCNRLTELGYVHNFKLQVWKISNT